MEESKAKLNLVAVSTGRGKSLVEERPVFVTVSPKYGKLVIGAPALQSMQMDNKLYRLFYDVENKVIAWQLKESLEQAELASKEWKLAKMNEKTRNVSISAGKVLEALGVKGEKSFACEIKKYTRKDSLLEFGDCYFIVCVEPTE